jgi:hypothetical protein
VDIRPASFLNFKIVLQKSYDFQSMGLIDVKLLDFGTLPRAAVKKQRVATHSCKKPQKKTSC